ncbi:carbohydrate-binding family 9-like protein [Vibrio hangzhouensis]|uniref:Carbohydrate family 9 binding domain-like n=1 Tax=Vibrio hangzhouensis TaxID=462991 RepID=A0A1H6B7U9_9VIBR|nr:carbohydrate-binding family 9-like protein [Vibrio hangzhouensis]SEG56919.1 Carbohydrate family 9 binding domain-like [Vibrio hangzhouensis]
MYTKLLPVLVVMSSSVFAMENSEITNKVYQIKYAKVMPTLGDSVSSSVWDSANTLTDFTLPWRDAVPPNTEFKALWNDDALYIQYRVEDQNVVIGENPERGALDSDRVEIFLSQDKQLSNYYTLEVDATTQFYSMHAQYDLDRKKIGSRNDKWHWDNVETYGSKTNNGYHVEMKIPLETITKLDLWQNSDKTVLLCALMRAEFTRLDSGDIDMAWMTWVDPKTEKPNFHNPDTFGECHLVN